MATAAHLTLNKVIQRIVNKPLSLFVRAVNDVSSAALFDKGVKCRGYSLLHGCLDTKQSWSLFVSHILDDLNDVFEFSFL